MIIATGDWAAVTFWMSSMAMVREIRNSMPEDPGGHDRTDHRPRHVTEGVLGLLRHVGGGVEALQRGQSHDHGEHQSAADTEVVGGVLRDALRGEVGHRPVAADERPRSPARPPARGRGSAPAPPRPS